jgi:hypothetical protein
MSVSGAKLALLIPRLASEFDGEVIATVRAMRRLLNAGGHDLHDLARVVADGNYVAENHGGALTAQLKELLCSARLNDWEREFVASVLRQTERHGFRLSDKQRAILNRILGERHG